MPAIAKGSRLAGIASSTHGIITNNIPPEPRPWSVGEKNEKRGGTGTTTHPDKFQSVCPYLSPKGRRNKINPFFVFDAGGVSDRLCSYIFWENDTRYFVGELVRDILMELGA